MHRLRSQTKAFMALLLVPIILFGDSVVAQSAARAEPERGLDEVFVFRAVLSAICVLLIWLFKKADTRLHKLEEDNQESKIKRQEGFSRLGVLEQRSQVIENDNKQILSMVALQRELLLTQYEDKETTEKHWNMLNKTLDDHRMILTNISTALAAQVRKPGEERRRN